MRVILVLACLIFFSLAAYAEPLSEGDIALIHKDYPKALRLLQPLADKGDAHAQFQIATMYFSGQGVDKNWQTAAQWFRKAAEQGDFRSQTLLGALLAQDQFGMKHDYAEAVKWSRKAAEHDSGAAFNLGMLSSSGMGVPQDYAEAYFWFSLAARDKRIDGAVQYRDEAVKHLSKDQVATVDKRLAAWLNEHPVP